MTAGILTAIHNKIPLLSKGQKRIAAFILENPEQAAVLTAAALGKTVQVSESTVVRFAAELGFKGYPEMQKALQAVVLSRLTEPQPPSPEEPGNLHPLEALLQAETAAIRKTGEQLDKAAFDRGVTALLEAGRIYIFASETAEALASYAYGGLSRIFEAVCLLSGRLPEKIIDMKAGDVLLLLCPSPYTPAAASVTEYSRRVGARTIVVTDSPAAVEGDCVLEICRNHQSLLGSLGAYLWVLEGLMEAAASERTEVLRQREEKLKEIWNEYHVYEETDQ